MVLSLYVTLNASAERVVVGGDEVDIAREDANRWYSTMQLNGFRTPARRFSLQ